MARQRLQQRRRELNLSQEELAFGCGLAPTTYGEYERGETTPRVGEKRRRLAKGLKVELDELDWYLVDENGQSDQRLKPGWFNVYVSLEQTAVSIRTWQPSVVPGLLQTPGYATALLGDKELVKMRLLRQAMLAREDDPLHLIAVLDESVLDRPLGGHDVLLGQLEHLAAEAVRPNVDIHILPLASPEQPFYFGALNILGFDWAEDGLVYTEHSAGAVYLDTQHDRETHTTGFARLAHLAASADESLDIIEQRTRKLLAHE